MELEIKIKKMKEMGFVDVNDNEFILSYNGYKWSKMIIEATSMAEIIKYKSFYDGNISVSELNRMLSIIRNY